MGAIIAIVCVVSLLFSLGLFLALLMVVGPLRTRRTRDDCSAGGGAPSRPVAGDDAGAGGGGGGGRSAQQQEEAEEEVGGPVRGLSGWRHGDGWALRVDVSGVLEPDGAHYAGGGMELQFLGASAHGGGSWSCGGSAVGGAAGAAHAYGGEAAPQQSPPGSPSSESDVGRRRRAPEPEDCEEML